MWTGFSDLRLMIEHIKSDGVSSEIRFPKYCDFYRSSFLSFSSLLNVREASYHVVSYALESPMWQGAGQ